MYRTGCAYGMVCACIYLLWRGKTHQCLNISTCHYFCYLARPLLCCTLNMYPFIVDHITASRVSLHANIVEDRLQHLMFFASDRITPYVHIILVDSLSNQYTAIRGDGDTNPTFAPLYQPAHTPTLWKTHFAFWWLWHATIPTICSPDGVLWTPITVSFIFQQTHLTLSWTDMLGVWFPQHQPTDHDPFLLWFSFMCSWANNQTYPHQSRCP